MNKIELKNMRKSEYALDEAYRTLRTNILFSSFDTKVISVTSCNPDDGKSTVSFELAKSLAEVGKKVLFVDADMRQSDFITKHTATVDLKGLSHFLSGQAPIGEVLNSTDYENLYVIFSGVYPPNPTELLTSKVFTDFVAEAKENFDFVIIDTPPLGLVSDAAVCIAQSDGVAMVVSSGKTSLKKAKEVKRAIESIGTKILGCILNNVRSSKNKRYYYRYY
ncbi:MAG: CpsD/CapB family tyrosine-protein kinase [Ruminococcaceae bacterium]|nr:CpsD/CapB family tyrosine-protein kinase [Oscillospiraceae bacterium]